MKALASDTEDTMLPVLLARFRMCIRVPLVLQEAIPGQVTAVCTRAMTNLCGNLCFPTTLEEAKNN